MTIDLFRPHMAPSAREAAARALTPDADGRLFIGQGPVVEAFERELTRVFQSDVPLLTTNSGTNALDLALHLCGVGFGQYVITTPMTCSATNSPIATRGAVPLWADVDALTGLIDPASVARILERRPEGPWVKAVVAVDWGGRACDYDALRAICHPLRIPIIEDAAHAALGQYRGRSIAYMGGDYVAWSFQAIKHLTTVDGGALRVPPNQYRRAKLLRWYGLDRDAGDSFRCSQTIDDVGFKYHMHDVAAAIGLANLTDLPNVVYQHRENARFYCERLAGLPGIRFAPFDAGCSYWLFTILVDDRDGFIAYLADRGIAASPVHRRNDDHPGFGGPLPRGTLPGVDQFAAHEVAVPVGWWLTPAERVRVAGAVQEYASHAARYVPDPPAARNAAEAQTQAEAEAEYPIPLGVGGVR